MKKMVIVLIPFLLIFLENCKKNDESNVDLISISGITAKDEYGDWLGIEDTTDWKFDDKWDPIIESLFTQRNIKNQKSSIPVPPQTPVISAYPNPTHSIANLYISLSPSSYCDVRIVDNKLNKIFSIDSVGQNLVLDFDSSIYKNHIYRVYYKIYYSETVLRGHGDIKVDE